MALTLFAKHAKQSTRGIAGFYLESLRDPDTFPAKVLPMAKSFAEMCLGYP
jgi:hypothetical protein